MSSAHRIHAHPRGACRSTKPSGPPTPALEEAKADVVGMFGLDWLIEHGAMPKEKRTEYYASYVGGIFRTVRFGIAEAHGRAEMMEFNYLVEHGAITRDPGSGRYAIGIERMPAAIASLAKELLEMEATGDRARVEAWFAKYDRMPDDLAKIAGGQQRYSCRYRPGILVPRTCSLNRHRQNERSIQKWQIKRPRTLKITPG